MGRMRISPDFSGLSPLLGRFLRVTHPSATRQHPEGPATVRLACVKHASVQSGARIKLFTLSLNCPATKSPECVREEFGWIH